MTTKTHIAPLIYEKIVHQCLESIPGVVTPHSHIEAGMSAVAHKVTGSSHPKVHIELQEYDNPAALPSCTVSLRIAVLWPCPLSLLIQCVQKAVVQHLRSYTDMIALKVDVDISSILPQPGHRITAEDLENYSQNVSYPKPTPIKGDALQPQPLSIPQLSGEGVTISSPSMLTPHPLSPLPPLSPLTPWIQPEVISSYPDLPIRIEPSLD